jgi:hypothetical protein
MVKDMKGEKTYVIKGLIHEYHSELWNCLKKLDGLTERDINIMVGNEMRDIGNYAYRVNDKNDKK